MVGAAAKMFVAGAAFTSTGLHAAGRTLVRGLHSKEETVRTIAGILLVKAGAKSGPLLAEAIQQATPEQLPMLLRILGDLGDARWDDLLTGYTASDNPEIAQAASDARKAAQFARQERRVRG